MLYQTLINAPAHARTPPHTNTRYRTGWSMVEDSVRLVRFILQVSTRRGDARSAFAGKITHPSNRAGYTGELSHEHRMKHCAWVPASVTLSQSLCEHTRARESTREKERAEIARAHTRVRARAHLQSARMCVFHQSHWGAIQWTHAYM